MNFGSAMKEIYKNNQLGPSILEEVEEGCLKKWDLEENQLTKWRAKY
jgi:hypothetical protein